MSINWWCRFFGHDWNFTWDGPDYAQQVILDCRRCGFTPALSARNTRETQA